MTTILLNENFTEAAEAVKTLSTKPKDEELLKLYGLYKQSTVGNITKEKPSWWNLQESRKWEAWKSYEGTLQEDAKKMYIENVSVLMKSSR
jgi:diazepam-binding inhibitor (GABA receptor modulating acyl-CoA-binding protein)